LCFVALLCIVCTSSVLWHFFIILQSFVFITSHHKPPPSNLHHRFAFHFTTSMCITSMRRSTCFVTSSLSLRFFWKSHQKTQKLCLGFFFSQFMLFTDLHFVDFDDDSSITLHDNVTNLDSPPLNSDLVHSGRLQNCFCFFIPRWLCYLLLLQISDSVLFPNLTYHLFNIHENISTKTPIHKLTLTTLTLAIKL